MPGGEPRNGNTKGRRYPMPSEASTYVRAVFRPAVRLMNGLTFTAKFALLGFLSLIAISVVVTSLYRSLESVVDVSRKELDGWRLIAPASRATRLVQQHRARAASVLGGHPDSEAQRAAVAEEASESLNALRNALPSALTTSPRFAWIMAEWKRLAAEDKNANVTKNLEDHTYLINELRLVMVQIADDYALTLDPEIDTYYLIDSAVIKLPAAIESIGQIRAHGCAALAARSASLDEKLLMGALISNLERGMDRLQDNIERSAQYNPSIKAELAAASADASRSASEIVAIVRTDILNERFATSADEFYAMTTLRIDRLYDVISQTLDRSTKRLLEARIERATNALRFSVGIAGALFLVVLYFTVGIYLGTVGTIRSLAGSAKSFAGGDLGQRVALGTRDELKQVAESFNEMASSLATLLSIRKQNERRLQVILDTSLDAFVQMDDRGTVISWNPMAEKIFGWAASEVCGRPLDEVILPERHRDAHRSGLKALLGTDADENSRTQTTALHRAGHEVPVELSIAVNRLGDRVEFSAFIEDITQRIKGQEALTMSALVYQNSSEAMMVTDRNANILTVNSAFTQVTGFAPEEAIGKTPRILSSGVQDAAFYEAMWASIHETGTWKGELWNRRKDGTLFAEELTINTIFAEDGTPHRRVAIFSDITSRKQTEQTIWNQANFDSLTGLPNRAMFQHRLGQDLRKCHRSGARLALMFLDLDRFKEVNDSLGHQMGDLLLKEVAVRLTACVRETDMVARLGGDEFTIVLSDMSSLDRVAQIAQTVIDRLSQPVQLGAEVAYVSCSIGVTFYRNPSANGVFPVT